MPTSALLLYGHLNVLAQTPGVDRAKLLDVAGQAVANTRSPASARRAAVMVIGRLAHASDDQGPYSSALLGLIERSPEAEIKSTAAYTLKNFLKLDDRRIGEVKAARDRARDEDVRRLLDSVLEKSPD